MSFGTILHKVIDGVHHLFTSGVQAVEQVKVFIDARPGLKNDLDALLGPIKDAVVGEITARLTELKQSSPDQAVALIKADIPAILAKTKEAFLGQATHAGNVDLMLSLAANTALALLEGQR